MHKILMVGIFIILLSFVSGCAKRESVNKVEPENLLNKISDKFEELSENYSYKSDKSNEEIFNSKVEKFCVKYDSKNSEEVGIFKLYNNKIGADDLREIIAKRLEYLRTFEDSEASANLAEIREYGNYIYYVAHQKRDEIFKIIESELIE